MNKPNEKDLVKRIAMLIKHNQELTGLVKELTVKNEELQKKLDEQIKVTQQISTQSVQSADEERISKFKMATVLFADIQGFTKISDLELSHDIIDELDGMFIQFDNIVSKYKIEKIKTIGDTYMCTGGIPVKNITNPLDVVQAALEMHYLLYRKANRTLENGENVWDLRIGIHTGPVTVSTFGRKKVAYNIKGDTVNIASRLQSSGKFGNITISLMTYELVSEYFICEYCGKMPVKYIGDIEMYNVTGIKPHLCADGFSHLPNHAYIIKYLLRQFADLQEIILDMLEKELPRFLLYHNFKHTIDVVNQVELIGLGEGVSEEEILLLKTAALFHDAGHIKGYDNHEFFGTEIAKEFLPKYKYTDEQIEKICQLIMATKLPPVPKNTLEKIMCDSDLDYLGRSDFIPVSNTLFEELKAQNKITNINDWNKIQVKFISNHQYFTRTANNLREVNKQLQIERIKKLIVD